MWTTDSIRYFLNNDANEDEADKLFLKTFCSNATATNLANNKINTATARKIISEILRIVPDADASTPQWTSDSPGPRQLLVCFGKAHLEKRKLNKKENLIRLTPVLRQPRFGICGINGKLFLWTDDRLIKSKQYINPYTQNDYANWIEWPGRTGKVIFKDELNAIERFREGSYLWYFILWIGSEWEKSSFALDETLSSIRLELGIPEEYKIIIPKLVDAHLFHSPTKSTYEENTPAIDNVKLPIEHETSNEIPDSNSKACESIPVENKINKDSDNFNLTDSAHITGRYYVYALIDPHDNNRPFYIGKGFFDRAHAHFNIARSNTYSDDTEKENSDEKFLVGIESSKILQSEQSESNENVEAAKIAKIKSLLEKGCNKNDIVRVVARSLSKEAALAIESLLIKGVYGLGSLTNKVQGHHHERFRELGKFAYIQDYDLPCANRRLTGDVPKTQKKGAFYVYVLLDPNDDKVFYVGKGYRDRLCHHFAEAENNTGNRVPARISKIRKLFSNGYQSGEIGRIVARVDNEYLAYAIESFYIKFVVGFRNLENIQPGHLGGMFRSRDDWSARHGFDFPTNIGGMRRQLNDIFLGEGLDSLLLDVISDERIRQHQQMVEGPKLVGAGELAYLVSIKGMDPSVCLCVQVRCARRIQLSLYPRDASGRAWIQKYFGKFGLYPLFRRDDRFTPRAWIGATNLMIGVEETICRAERLIKLGLALHLCDRSEHLNAFHDLLVGLPNSIG